MRTLLIKYLRLLLNWLDGSPHIFIVEQEQEILILKQEALYDPLVYYQREDIKQRMQDNVERDLIIALIPYIQTSVTKGDFSDSYERDNVKIIKSITIVKPKK